LSKKRFDQRRLANAGFASDEDDLSLTAQRFV
jgi:hypothetical protein